jgi:hypothetical protein
MTPPSTDLPRTCECGCGTPTGGQWARGHHTRGVGGFNPARHLTPLPDIPDPASDDAGDVGDLDPAEPDTDGFGDWPPGWDDGRADYGPRGKHAGPAADEPADEQPLGPDPQPGPLRDTRPRGTHHKITAGIRKDIDAKVGIMLELPGRVWEARDPLCGAVFVQQLPSTRSALVDLICQSPDLVAWFTGVGGGFMLYLNLLAALQPVAVTVWAHHIAHSIETPGQQAAGPGPQLHDGQAYAA